MSDGDEQEARLVNAKFSSWKLDVVDALLSSPELAPSDIQVAILLLQHLNGKTWKIYPSQELVAEITHMSARNVRKRLDQLKNTGWLRWERGHLKKANEYEFSEHKVSEEVARMKAEKAARQRRKKKGVPGAERNHSSGQTEHLSGTTVPVGEEPQFRPTPLSNQGGSEHEPVQEADAA